MRDAPVQSLFFLITVLLLLIFQAVAAVQWFPENYWVAIGAFVLLDTLLIISYAHSARKRRKLYQRQFDQIDKTLFDLLTLVHNQQEHWKTLVDSLSEHEYEDPDVIESIRDIVTTMSRIDGIPKTKELRQFSHERIIDTIQTFVLLSDSLITDLDQLITFFGNTYTQFQDVRLEIKLIQFRLSEAVHFLDNMSQATGNYSNELFQEILKIFKDITTNSKAISADVKTSVALFMDPDNPQSLESINQETKEINLLLDNFFQELEKSILYSGKFLKENSVQMERIRVMAESIAEFSENIRMISLNVNIEAARTTFSNSAQNGSNVSGKGFQVLAVKLSEYASKAQEMAREQQEVIDSASNILTSSGMTLKNSLDTLVSHLPVIRNKLYPFEQIVTSTFDQFEALVSEMEKMSYSTDDKLKYVLGKLQFQDLVRQEQEHMLSMFTLVRDLSKMGTNSNKELNERQRNEAINGLLQYYESIASTENELNVIREYRILNPFLSVKEQDNEMTAGSVKLF